MQDVTLLRPRQIFQLGTGPQSHNFFEGITVAVADDIAEKLRAEKGSKGRPMFRIEPVGASDPDADVAEALGVQLKFKAYGG